MIYSHLAPSPTDVYVFAACVPAMCVHVCVACACVRAHVRSIGHVLFVHMCMRCLWCVCVHVFGCVYVS